MSAPDDPVALLPMAVAGLLIGAGLAAGSGYGLHLQWSGQARADATAPHATVEGRIAWAGWRASAAGEGPDWYLEVRLADRPRGFLVAAPSLTDTAQARYGPPAAGRGISALSGRRATVVVDSSLLARPAQHPYLAALRVEGETVVPLGDEQPPSSPWVDWPVGLLLGVGLLVGVGLVGVSLQHIVVSVQHTSGEP